ncbi:MAG: tetratricopeptide repeat protein [Anaerolineae bacterium]|nr:tetratricopeptide repeat protein [Anaerolineae bacterium]
MSNPLRTAAAYVPLSLTRAALNGTLKTLPNKPQTSRFQAAVLFADVSGFTPLTEALGQRGTEGPEELTRLLNRYFSWMIAFAEAEGGEVVKFGGDSLIVVFATKGESLGMATRRAKQAAENMQLAMDEFGVLESSVGLVALKLKVGIGAGEIISAHIGGVENRWEYIIAGDPLQQTAQAENQARQGEIVLSPEAEAIIHPVPLPSRPIHGLNWESIDNVGKAEHILRCYIPRPVRTWLDQELHGWLASLRPMSVLFAGIKNFDYSQPQAIERLHTFMRCAQQSIYHFQGCLPRITVDDKGTVFLILFGAPPDAHEDDPERAVRCALELQALAQKQQIQLAIGITTGRVFAGPVGGDTRHEYTVMGDTVNLAARLMSVAGPGRICCNYETYRSTYNQIRFEYLTPTQIKGKAGLVPIYRPTGEHSPLEQLGLIQQTGSTDHLVARQEALAALTQKLKDVKNGNPRISIIEGEAGIGKSQLVHALVRRAQNYGLMTLLGRGKSVEQAKPLRVWQDIFSAYFNLDQIDTFSTELHHHIINQLSKAAPTLTDRACLLNELLNTNLPESTYVRSLSPEERQNELIWLMITLLKTKANEHPLVVVVEDAQWIDELSWKFTVLLAVSAIKDKTPIFLIVATRLLEGVTMRTNAILLGALEETEYVRLEAMQADDTLTIAAMKLGLSRYELPEAVAELIRQRAGGNPFFAEEIFYALRDHGFITFKAMQDKVRCLVSGDLNRAAQTLPPTIQNIILSRIDRLPPEKQLILRVAAVIGQTFPYTILRDTLKKHLEIKDNIIKVYLDDLVHLGLIEIEESLSDTTYTFKHTIIREVTYQSLLFDRRRQLHRSVARWYEDTFKIDTDKLFLPPEVKVAHRFSSEPSAPLNQTPLSPYYALLVYHWHQAEDENRERYYASLVGQQAVTAFANAEAVGYLNRALFLTPRNNEIEHYNLLLARETVYHRLGDRARQKADLTSLTELAQHINNADRLGVVALHWAWYAEATSNYPEAITAAQEAATYAKQSQNISLLIDSYIVWGQALTNQNKFDTAYSLLEKALAKAQQQKSYLFEAKCLQALADAYYTQGNYLAAQACCQRAFWLCQYISQPLVKADTLNILGLVAYHQGDLAAARKNFEQAILIYYGLGHKRNEIKTFHNIGLLYLNTEEYDIARDYFEQVLDIGREIQDRQLVAEALCNLGITYCYQGDYPPARSYLGQSLGIREEIGNQLGEADSLSKLSVVYYYLGSYQTTKRYCELAIATARKLKFHSGESYSLTYLGHALVELGHLKEAFSAYEQALQLRYELNQQHLTIDILVGIANIAVAQGQREKAIAYVNTILSLSQNQDITGTNNLAWVHLKVYNILTALSQINPSFRHNAQGILQKAHANLQQKILDFQNGQQRRNYLENVQWHQAIVTICEKEIEPSLITG